MRDARLRVEADAGDAEADDLAYVHVEAVARAGPDPDPAVLLRLPCRAALQRVLRHQHIGEEADAKPQPIPARTVGTCC